MSEIDYEVIRSKRKTLAIEVKSDGKVIVRAPKVVSKKYIDKFVEEKRDWILKHQAKAVKKMDDMGGCEPVDEALKKELKSKAMEIIPEKLERYAIRLGVSYNKVSYRFQRGRWGSCSSKKNLNFNCMLMLTPDEVIDYVVVHELCHLIEMNHSERFWAQVENVLPDYKKRRQWLKSNGSAILARLDATDKAEKKKYYTYMVRCSDNSIYVGYTPDLENRLRAHNSGNGAKYTKYKRPVKLVYYEEFETKSEAQSREVILKQLSHREKERLIAREGNK